MPREQKPNQIQVAFLMNKADHAKVKEKADALGMSLASYFKFVALNAEIKVIVGGKGE
jgi:hypoxanthine-guanine phosphoribosyltransferase